MWSKFWSASWWVKAPVIGAVVFVSLIIVAAIAGGGSGDEDGDETVAEQTETATATTASEPTAEPTSAPTEAPTPEPTAVGPATSFGEGNKQVNQDIAPGTYRGNLESDLCYWERLSGFSGELDDIIANGNPVGPEIVTIAPSDMGFNSTGCGQWNQGLARITDSQTDPFEAGTFAVGIDIAAGTWSAQGGETCYWERLSGFGHAGVDEIIANDVGTVNPIVTVAASDVGFSTSGCGAWTSQG